MNEKLIKILLEKIEQIESELEQKKVMLNALSIENEKLRETIDDLEKNK